MKFNMSKLRRLFQSNRTDRKIHRNTPAVDARMILEVTAEPLEPRRLLASAPFLIFSTSDGQLGDMNYKPGGPGAPPPGQAYDIRKLQPSSSQSKPFRPIDIINDRTGSTPGKLLTISETQDATAAGDTSALLALQDQSVELTAEQGSNQFANVSEGDLAVRPSSFDVLGVGVVVDGQQMLFRARGDGPSIIGPLTSPTFTPSDVSGLAFVPSDVFGESGDFALIGLGSATGRTDSIFRIDPASGAISNVIPLSQRLGSTAGFVCDPESGECYVADGGNGGTDSLYRLNPVNGNLSLIGAMNLPGGASGLAFGVPGDRELNGTAAERADVQGSFIYIATYFGTIDFAGDSDQAYFGYKLIAQNISVRVDIISERATFRPKIEILSVRGTLETSAVAASDGESVIVSEPVPEDPESNFRLVRVSDAGNSAAVPCHYQVTILYNASLEAEAKGASTNDSRATAQRIDANGVFDRSAVRGTLDAGPQAEDWYSFSANLGQFITVGLEENPSGYYFGQPVPATPRDMLLEVYNSSGELVASGVDPGNSARSLEQVVSQLQVKAGTGLYYARVRNDPTKAGGGGVYHLMVFRRGDFDIEPNDAASPQPLHFNLEPNAKRSARVIGELRGIDNDIDAYLVTLEEGESVETSITQPFPFISPYANTPVVQLFDPSGNLVPSLTALVSGVHILQVRGASNQGGDYVLNINTFFPVIPSFVVGRRAFYNNSVFDGHDDLPNAADDNAIALDKAILLPGRNASSASYSSYTKGINGLMIDVVSLPRKRTLSADDFTFRVAFANNPSQLVEGPQPKSVTVRRDAGINGSDRVTLIWADYDPRAASPQEGAVANGWLQVTMKADADTALLEPDVFYFGNLIGDTADSDSSGAVSAADLVRVRNAVGASAATIVARTDLNRDGTTNASDLVIVRNTVGVALPPPPSFSYGNFLDPAGLELFGSAALANGAVRIVPASPKHSGGVRRRDAQILTAGFATSFWFRYSNIGGLKDIFGNAGTDGIGFTLQPEGSGPPVLAGAGLCVWFDAFQNSGDASYSRVGIYLNGTQLAQADLVRFNIILQDSQPHVANITYDGSRLRVSVGGSTVATVTINASRLPGRALVGFAGFEGEAYGDQDLLSWSFNSSPVTPFAPFSSLQAPPDRFAPARKRQDVEPILLE